MKTMPLQLILGSSGSGKSYQLYEQVIQKSMEHKDTNYIVIVPEQFTMQTQKDLVTMHPRHGIMNIDILSFLRLAYRIFDEVGHKEQVILEDTGKSMLLRKVVANKSKDLKLFQSNVRKQGFIGELKSLISEILQYSISESDLEKMSSMCENRPMLQAKLQDITTIYKGFRELMENQYITAEEILQVLTDVVDQSEIIRNSVICFDGFTGFTPIQYKLLSRLCVLAKSVVVTVTIDPRENPDVVDDEFKLFHMSKKTIEKLVNIAKDNDVKVMPYQYTHQKKTREIPYRFRNSKALASLEHNLFRYGGNYFEEEQDDISIHAAMDKDQEVNFVIREIKHLLREKGYRYKDIAVISGDIASYGTIFRRKMEEEKIPCFIDNKKDILANAYVEYLRSAIEIVLRDFSYEAVFRYLRCGLSGILIEDIDEIENYVIALGIRGHGMWKKEWKETYRVKRPLDMVRINEVREEIVNQFEELYPILKNKDTTIREMTTALYEFSAKRGIYEKLMGQAEHFKENGLPLLAKEYEQIYRIVMELFDQFVELLGEEVIPLAEYDKILEAGLSEAKVGLIPPGMDQIVVGDTTRTRLKDIKALFFVGVNDGIIPSSNHGGGILSDMDRELFAQLDVELAPTRRQNAYMEQFYLYLNMTKPQEKLYLTYCKVGDDGKAMRPSYLIGRVIKMFPKIHVYEEDEVVSLESILGNAGGREHLIKNMRELTVKEPDDIFKELYSYYFESEEYKEMLTSLIEGAFFLNKERGLSKYVANTLYGSELMGSVTRLERFASCAFAHFMAYGMGLKEREEYKIMVPDIGNLFHMALEMFSKKLEESEYDWQTIPDDVREEWASYCVHVAVEQYGHSVLHSNKRNEYLIHRVERIQKRTVWALSEQMKQGDFKPYGYEIPFTYHMERRNKEEVPVRLIGRIDRLDIMENEKEVLLKVIDYKSGKTNFDPVSLYYGLQMQLAIYLSVAIQFAQKQFKDQEIIPAGILYYHIDDPIIERTIDIQKQLLKQLKMNGLVNSDMQIVKHLDKNFAGENGEIQKNVTSNIVPVASNKEGFPKKTSSIASNVQFKALSEYVRKKMDVLCCDIMQGDVQVNPYKLGEKTACDYCEYSGICGFDLKIPGYRYRKLAEMKKEEVFEAIKEEVEEDGITREDNERKMDQ